MDTSKENTIFPLGKRPYTKREWILLLILLLLTDSGICLYIGYNSTDADILNFTSFASTIISIILAVLAIMYSYYLNAAQLRDSQSLSSQIDQQQKLLVSLKKSAEKLSEEINRVGDIPSLVQHGIDLNTEKFGQIQNTLSELTKPFSSASVDENNSITYTNKEIELFLTSKINYPQYETYLALYISVALLGETPRWEGLYVDYLQGLSDTVPPIAYFAILGMLESMTLVISENSKIISLNPIFSDLIRDILFIHNPEDKKFKSSRNELVLKLKTRQNIKDI